MTVDDFAELRTFIAGGMRRFSLFSDYEVELIAKAEGPLRDEALDELDKRTGWCGPNQRTTSTEDA